MFTLNCSIASIPMSTLTVKSGIIPNICTAFVSPILTGILCQLRAEVSVPLASLIGRPVPCG